MLRLMPTLLMLAFALGMGARRPEIPPNTAPTPAPTQLEQLVARLDRNIKVEVKSLKGFNGEQELRFRHIVAGVEKVVNLKLFEDMVKGHTYNGKLDFVDTDDTTVQVYEKITSADWKLEYRLEYLWRKSTIGYTLPDVDWIAFNSRRWYNLEDADIAANICHEYGGHKFGRYSHAATWSYSRDFSAPYGIGTICETLYRKLYK